MSSVLPSLAILKVELDAGRDYIDGFLPLILEALRSTEQPEISLPELQELVAKDFGIHMPQGALKTVLQRASRRGFVQREEGVYRKVDAALDQGDFASIRADCVRQQDALVARLTEYARAEHSVEWSTEEAEVALLAFIRQQSLPILNAAVEGAPIRLPDSQDHSTDFIVGGFIAKVAKADPEAFGFLEATVKGSMLADVLYYPELGQAARRFSRAEIFLDTPVILRALGLTMSGEAVAYRETIDLLYELNASIRCFEHTLEEVKGVLHAASLALSRPQLLRASLADATEHFIRAGSTPSDVELMIARLENSLASLHVRVDANPGYSARTTIDEKKLGSLLMDQVGYAREETMEHDLKAVASIFALRNAGFPQSIEDCDAIFVTNNTSLVRATMNFFRNEYGERALLVPLAIPLHTISTLAWLKKPARAPGLPDKMVIANSYAAPNPPDKLWRLYLDEISELEERGDITQEDYALLRFSSEARSLLMDRTLGDHTAFAEGTVSEILARAKENIRQTAERKFEKERLDRLSTQRQSLAYQTNIEQRIRNIAARIARITRWAVLGVGGIFLVGGSVLTFPGTSVISSPLVSNILFAVLVLATILSVLNGLFGTSVSAMARQVEMSIFRSVEERLLTYFTGSVGKGE